MPQIIVMSQNIDILRVCFNEPKLPALECGFFSGDENINYGSMCSLHSLII